MHRSEGQQSTDADLIRDMISRVRKVSRQLKHKELINKEDNLHPIPAMHVGEKGNQNSHSHNQKFPGYQECWRCLGTNHTPDQCYLKDKTCTKCHKM
mmetsp:Transcript_342/g.349  ORF Transcript_342/g.349 Transcript_342/m.349 type:complete len:97 (-) Transcript_342:1304-1594(-)